MNIAIAGRSMNTPGGVKEYLEGICYGLSELELPKDIKLYFFASENGKKPSYCDNIEFISTGTKNKLLWDHITLPRLLKKYHIDVVLHVKNVVPLTVKTPSVVVVHDLLHLLQPEVYKTADSMYMQYMMKKTLPQAKKIIAVSQNTKKDLLYAIPNLTDEKVDVIYEDAMPRFDSAVSKSMKSAFQKQHNVPEKFILLTSSLSPRKNVERLLEAFSRVQNSIDHHLVVTGGKAWKQESIHAKLTELELQDRVHILGFIPDEDMATLYQLADMYVYPSLYEGFGIPVLEAFASKTPVICSNTSSIPEVAGDGAYVVNPTSVEEIADAISAVATNEQLRAELIERGSQQRQKFSWKRSSQKLLDTLITAAQ